MRDKKITAAKAARRKAGGVAMSENCLDPQTRKPRLLSAQCETCGWRWPLPGEPPVDAECDNCGGDLIEQED